MIGDNIKKLRIRNGFSLRSLADILCISHTAISKIEKGDLMPSSEILIKISKAFNVKVSELFKEPQKELEIKEINYRKSSKFTLKNKGIVEEITKEKLQKYLEVEDIIPYKKNNNISIEQLYFTINSLDEIEENVVIVRDKLKLGLDPISNMINLLEALGIIVIFIDTIKGFDGKEGLVNNKPFIIVANDKPGDRQRYNLAHELGHLIVKFDNLDPEQVANYFAGAFLIPRESLLNDLGEKRKKLSLFELENLKRKYKVSMQSIIFRAHQLGIINEYEKTRLFKQFSMLGYRKNEPVNIEKEETFKFENMICELVSEGYISESKAAEYLNIRTLEFVEKYMGQRTNDIN